MERLLELIRIAFAVEKKTLPDQKVDSQMPPQQYERLDAAVRGCLAEYCASAAADWTRYAHTCEEHYVRNLVHHCEDFELIVICWCNKQESRIHNHGTSHCWLTVLDGSVMEKKFEHEDADDAAADAAGDAAPLVIAATPPTVPGVLSSRRPCPKLRPVSTSVVQAGETSYITDRLGLHAVGHNSSGERTAGTCAVTLHLYAPPIHRTRLYEVAENRVVTRTPGFYSVGGKVLPPKPAGVAARENLQYGGAAPAPATAVVTQQPHKSAVAGGKAAGAGAAEAAEECRRQ